MMFCVILISSVLFFFMKDLPKPNRLAERDLAVTTRIYDRNHKLLFRIYEEKDRTLIHLEDVPKHLLQATIAMEDHDFYKHSGFDLRGIIRSVREILFEGKLQGGSTITQQLVKNALLSPERTVKRKIKELILSFQVERLYTKDQILQMYLNEVPYGGTAWGVQAASEMYFNKSVSELTIGEAALLAGLPASPTTYSPFGAHPELAVKRQQEVLRRMVEDKYISQEEANEAQQQKLVFAPQQTDIHAPHFVMLVRQMLEETYGEHLVAHGGLEVITTLDLDLQNTVQSIVREELEKVKQLRVGNGAALVTNPKTGEILAMVGSKDYFDVENDGNVNVTTSFRQPGSSIKPLNYALFFEKGYTPATLLLDVPTEFIVKGQPPYRPGNYDGQSHGAVQVRFALGNSYNIPAVKVLASNGVPDFIRFAQRLGITTFTDPSRYGLSLTLGGGEVTMTDMAVAYSVFANLGKKQHLQPILKVTDYRGTVLEEYIPQEGENVLSPEISYLISHILLDNNARMSAFGATSLLRIPGHAAVSVKTGTTDDKKDNWTIGYTPSYLTAVWVGNNDGTPMHPFLTSGVTGAAPIWNKIMTHVLKNQPDEWPQKPNGITGLPVCSLSGKLPSNDCPIRYEFFIKDQEPKEFDDSKQHVFLHPETGEIVPQDQPHVETDAIILSDPLTKQYCYSCTPPKPLRIDLSRPLQ